MRRKGSLIRIEAIREVRTSVATFGGGVITQLDARRPAPADGEPDFTYQVVFDDLDRELETVQDKLVSAEDAHTRSRIRRRNLARSSEELTTGLYDRQVATRRTLAGVFGPERLQDRLAAGVSSFARLRDRLAAGVSSFARLQKRPAAGVRCFARYGKQGASGVRCFARSGKQGAENLFRPVSVATLVARSGSLPSAANAGKRRHDHGADDGLFWLGQRDHPSRCLGQTDAESRDRRPLLVSAKAAEPQPKPERPRSSGRWERRRLAGIGRQRRPNHTGGVSCFNRRTHEGRGMSVPRFFEVVEP